MKPVLYFLAAMLLLNACTEKPVIPKADFDYQLADASLAGVVKVFPTHEPIRFSNISENGSTFAWKLRGSTFSEERETVYTFTNPGTYPITLTTTSATGDTQAITKEIKVVDRVLDKITVESLVWNAIGTLPTWPADKAAAVQVEVGYKIASDPSGALYHLLLRSAAVENASGAVAPLQVPFTGTTIFEPPMFPALVVELHGKDETGRYLAFSSAKIPGGLTAGYEPDGGPGRYVIKASAGGTRVALAYRFEP